MNEAAEVELRTAIEAIERASATEVVVAVRPRLRRWLIPHVLVGAAALLAVLAFALFSDDYEVALWTIAVAP
ncbi:MAG: hypothetical protein H7138_00975, partial [Myxococcales bacterium]|nr:hypothetical protein [Myxococcales bacterium]